MKRSISVLFLVIAFSPSVAFAGGAPAEENFPSFYTVGSDGSKTEDNFFEWDETPFAYGKVDAVSANRHAHVQTDWYFNSLIEGEADEIGATQENEFWLTPLNWNSIKQTGIWTVKGFFQVYENSDESIFKTGLDEYNFTVGAAPTVTPEPISMALFGAGAGALGLTRRLRRKK